MFEKEVNEFAVTEIFERFKVGHNTVYDDEKHCKLILGVMMDYKKGTIGSFCVEAFIIERTFWTWLNAHPLFNSCYSFGKVVARQIWEEEGQKLRDREYPMGTINHEFEHWKMIGWSRFGVSKNSRIKLNLSADGNPLQHYREIIKQACDGDFTASEFKQLLEAVNVGLNAHNAIELQKEIDELKSDLSTLSVNKDVQNPFTNKGTA